MTTAAQREFIDRVHTFLALQHPNLLRIYGTSSSGLDTFVISPFLDLTPVFVRIDACHSLERRPIVLGVARALSYLHSHDIIHGGLDAYHVFLSPSNERPVFVHTSGTGVVGDKAQGKLDANFLAHPFDVRTIFALLALPYIQDANEEAVKNIPADVTSTSSDTEGYVDAWILSPPTVYGASSGIAGVAPRNSFQIPMIIAMALKMGQAVVVGEGTATWDNVHVQDLVEAYILFIAKALSSVGSKGFFTKLFNSNSKSSYAKFHNLNVASDRHARRHHRPLLTRARRHSYFGIQVYHRFVGICRGGQRARG
ncbi:hypothetical protein EXIGLDRAFT_776479 [Exidia glandulosa HHB12029]|uniref:Protein kinase domain-containing protein n=1 Tax=Exidia glandulosa HHB12029 TaxID=1314781 RepID=A0A165DGN3_EXIGL|nr:hypothetical protein EXIGLDRAFT_776479 [Exidia glandulosa HHB12029]